MSDTKVTLLFAHGGGFCKETWDPIICRVKSSDVVQNVDTEFLTFDFPYHGENHDPDALENFRVDLSKPKAPRVWNDKHDLVKWVAAAVQEQVSAWKEKNKMEDPEGKTEHKLIGVGHSMGSAGLWATEVAHPGTFDGLILFEPVLAQQSPETDFMIDFMVGITLQRVASWPSRAAAEAYFNSYKNFAKWGRESLAAYVQGAVVEAGDGTVSLACHPNIEASLYCQPPLWLTEDELQQPKCPITFQWGSRSKMWFRHRFEALQAKLPHTYTMREAMEGTSHVLVFEDPALATERICQDLAQLEPFKEGP